MEWPSLRLIVFVDYSLSLWTVTCIVRGRNTPCHLLSIMTLHDVYKYPMIYTEITTNFIFNLVPKPFENLYSFRKCYTQCCHTYILNNDTNIVTLWHRRYSIYCCSVRVSIAAGPTDKRNSLLRLLTIAIIVQSNDDSIVLRTSLRATWDRQDRVQLSYGYRAGHGPGHPTSPMPLNGMCDVCPHVSDAQRWNRLRTTIRLMLTV